MVDVLRINEDLVFVDDFSTDGLNTDYAPNYVTQPDGVASVEDVGSVALSALVDEETPGLEAKTWVTDGTDSLESYKKQISDYKLLTKEEEVTLSKLVLDGQKARATLLEEDLTPADKKKLQLAAKKGDRAKDTLVVHNLRFVIFIARRYATATTHLRDLIQEGNIGLMRAAEDFDGEKGFRFTTYAGWWIRSAIGKKLGDIGHNVRLPNNVVELLRDIKQEREKLESEQGRLVGLEEVAESLGLSHQRFMEVYMFANDTVSLNKMDSEGHNHELIDAISDTKSADPGEEVPSEEVLRGEVTELLKVLSENQKRVVTLHYGLDGKGVRSYELIAKIMGKSRQYIREVEASAFRVIRQSSEHRLVEILDILPSA